MSLNWMLELHCQTFQCVTLLVVNIDIKMSLASRFILNLLSLSAIKVGVRIHRGNIKRTQSG